MKLPYGYVLVDDEIIIHEEKADVVRGIFECYLAGARPCLKNKSCTKSKAMRK